MSLRCGFPFYKLMVLRRGPLTQYRCLIRYGVKWRAHNLNSSTYSVKGWPTPLLYKLMVLRRGPHPYLLQVDIKAWAPLLCELMGPLPLYYNLTKLWLTFLSLSSLSTDWGPRLGSILLGCTVHHLDGEMW